MLLQQDIATIPQSTPLTLSVLAIVIALIAFRRVGRLQIAMWQAMAVGAVAVLATGQITPSAAMRAVNLDVLGFLLGIFVVAHALEASGYLAHVSARLFGKAESLGGLVGIVLVASAVGSFLLMNDTLAIVGTPVVLLAARRSGLRPTPLLLALAFGVTIGGVASPIGNPQNLLVATDSGMENAFVTFAARLALPSAVNLGIAYVVLRIAFRGQFALRAVPPTGVAVADERLARVALLGLGVVVALIAVRVGLALAGVEAVDLRLAYIALAGALPVAVLGRRRVELVRGIDWPTLVFFVAMFVLMQAVWDTGFFQRRIDELALDVTAVPVVLATSVLLSQVISNVPLVALYLPGLVHAGAGVDAMLALAAGSTIAGNLTVIGAASNVIIIQMADRTAPGALTFGRFFVVGAPLTVLNAFVYWVFLTFL